MAEDPADLVDGWPRVIVRDGDRPGPLPPDRRRDRWTWGPGTPPTPRPDRHARATRSSSPATTSQETEVTNGQFEDYLRPDRPVPPDRLGGGLQRRSSDDLRPDDRPEASRRQRHPQAGPGLRRLRRRPAPDRGPVGVRRPIPGREPPLRLGRHGRAEPRPGPDRHPDSGKTAPVGSFTKDTDRAGGLRHHGNVQEMCRDAWQPYRKRDRPDARPLRRRRRPGDGRVRRPGRGLQRHPRRMRRHPPR